uniref:Uncharacterized protein n=1 Tax=Siphoviridae sp. ct9Y44 TaxID=2826176 RepID=A0A8S5LYC5_9CAUD|nr:MAG TPA: hypothetical protein [Siphoviridae sp. ct9Y44]DAZ02101.1 MAG TPA: hypothetical protein [Caudoviricetes sp.]DAZ26301.1 MAG TPA: hypothetical protein [Caudoviricetes sp.]
MLINAINISSTNESVYFLDNCWQSLINAFQYASVFSGIQYFFVSVQNSCMNSLI